VTTVQVAPTNRDEITAVSLADEYAEEAVESLRVSKAAEGIEALTAAVQSLAHGVLALGARLDAQRETMNRELPDIGVAMLDAVREMPDGE
jgi:phage gp46-like protein